MLSLQALRILGNMLRLCCSLKLFPYRWDNMRKRLEMGGSFHILCYKVHQGILTFMTLFAIGRISYAMRDKGLPLPERIMSLAWCGVYTLCTISMRQFDTHGMQIRQFANYLIKYLESHHGGKYQANPGKKDKKRKERSDSKVDIKYGKDERKAGRKLARCLIISLILWGVNPTVHVLLVESNPCAPHFTSSLGLECENWMDGNTFLQKVPYILIEYYLIGVVITMLSFNWTMTFLGLWWVATELRKLSYDMKKGSPMSINRYRSLECIMNLLNSAFKPYLSTFPTLLFYVVSTLTFGVIRIWHNDFGSNLMFPICGLRCFYEAITPLAVAGMLNDRNKEVGAVWTTRVEEITTADDKPMTKQREIREMRAYRRSLNGIKCTAGSLYTFENSIVLCCLNNCTQLTLNLLVTFKQK